MNKTIYWAARGFAILFVLFLAMFALDVSPFSWGALFMHLLPSLILLVLLIISWKQPKIGGVLWILAGLSYVVMVWGDVHWSAYLAITGPAVVIGLLFWASQKNVQKSTPNIRPNEVRDMKPPQNKGPEQF